LTRDILSEILIWPGTGKFYENKCVKNR